MLSIATLLCALVSHASAADPGSRESIPARPVERPLLLRAGWFEIDLSGSRRVVTGGFDEDGERLRFPESVVDRRAGLDVRLGATDWLELGASAGVGSARVGRVTAHGMVTPELRARFRLLETLLPTASMSAMVAWQFGLPRNLVLSSSNLTPQAAGLHLSHGAQAFRVRLAARRRFGAWRLDAGAHGVVRLPFRWAGPDEVDLGDGVGTFAEVLLQVGPAAVTARTRATRWGPDRVGAAELRSGWTVVAGAGGVISLNRVIDVTLDHEVQVLGRSTWWAANPDATPGWGSAWRLGLEWRH